ncbi:hypothetical protein SEUBUCD646_0E01290 [Saccharomyces eubayanus]|uniref:BZIP domain-containing protein n=1 Tax=Saccharomyces pastorianus TaxID=27292 RepID=A0A6C1E6S3_SACPS|nr:hypothetical protein GRS66_007094 [Saccharomyces pastorianus]CAI1980185.1 hypothetical protein SEUBUCD646_0E01290 [Saccharomyces eubayanus]
MDYKNDFIASPDPLLNGRHNSSVYTDLLSASNASKEHKCKQQQQQQPVGLINANFNPYHQNTLNDRSVQKNLGPMFQPFGIDVTHMPITNPPIFQSSLPAFDQPVHKRRISISNGQISQLGEDLEAVENLYSIEPPFLSSKTEHNPEPQLVANPSTATYPSFGSSELPNLAQPQATAVPEVVPQASGQNIFPPPTPFDSNSSLHLSAATAAAAAAAATAASPVPRNNAAINQAYINMQLRLQAQLQSQVWKSAQVSVNPSTPASSSSVSSSTSSTSSSCQNSHDQNNEPLPIYSSIPHNGNNNTACNNAIKNDGTSGAADINSTNVYLKQEYNERIPAVGDNTNNKLAIPNQSVSSPALASVTTASSQFVHEPFLRKSGTSSGDVETTAKAWKRARLLERNRIAASKCRQRKKMSQLQLQKEFDQISKDNSIMKKKLEGYEKLVQKMKKVFKVHSQECALPINTKGNPEARNAHYHTSDGCVSLKMIEELIESSGLDG